MAPWHELVLAINLKEAVPQQVVDVLRILCIPLIDDLLDSDDPSLFEHFVPPEHPFFSVYEDEWSSLLRMNTYYFPGHPFGKLTYDRLGKFYKFTARAMVRLGEYEIGSFLHWLAPYSESKGMVGYTRCDETPQWIYLVYFDNDTVFYMRGDFSTNPVQMKRQTIAANGEATYEAE